MDYYIAWTHSDAIYHEFLPEARLLVSPPNVNQRWHVSAWNTQPRSLIIDSGAFQLARAGRDGDPSAVLDRQLAMVADSATPTGLCHLDSPLIGAPSRTELDRRVELSLTRARWLASRVADHLPAHIRPIGVIQGYSTERIYDVARALADMGYTSFALGSLAGMVGSARDEMLRRVEAAIEAIGTNVHILGVSSAAVLRELVQFDVASADSGAPIHEAWRGGVYYSQPFRRYKIPSPHMREWSRSYGFAEILTEPLPCDCPICQQDNTHLLEPQGKVFINRRAVHNTYHLMRELDSLRS